MFWYVIVVLIVASTIALMLEKKPKKKCNVYTQPGPFYYLKFITIYLILRLRRWRSQQESVTQGRKAGYGQPSRNTPAQMECIQPLSSHPKAIDAVYFNGSNENGCYLIGATARRPDKVINGFLYIKLPETGLLLSPRLPDTLMSASKEAFGAEGLFFQPVEAMRKWKLTYDGSMRLDKEDQLVHVCMNLDWESKLDYFDFDTDLHPIALAKAIARERWSKDFFRKLEDLHQTHYEQFGKITGTINIEGFGYHKVNLDSLRDHSYGDHRDWKYFHRYGLHMCSLDDGTQFNVGIVSQRNLLTVLELGYLYTPSGEKHPVQWCGLDLSCHGEGGTPPVDYGFEFEAGGKRYFVQCQVVASPELYIGVEWEARIVERLAKYTVNGVKGWGISEWHYRHHGGRPEKYTNRT